MEALSILENLKSMGVPIPDFITKKAHEIDTQINHGE
jgi:phage-related holin